MINLSKNSRNGEVYAVADRIITTYQQSTLKDNEALVKIMAPIKELTQKLSGAIKRMKAESILEEKDNLRDAALRALYYLVQGNTFHPEAPIKEAAQKLFEVLVLYSLETVKESYDDETSKLDSLLLDLKKEELAQSIITLNGSAPLIQYLEAAQNDFKNTRRAYQTEQALNYTERSATDIKKELTTLINDKLVAYLNGMLVVEEELFSPFATVVNQMITENNKVVRMRNA